MKVIIINGQGGAGKDTFVEFCRKYDYDTNIANFSTVEYVKRVAKLCGWKGEKTDKSRLLLSNLKDAMSQYNDKPYYSVVEAISHMLYDYHCYDLSTKDLIIFIHSREPEDIKRWVDTFKARTLLIHRSSEEIFTNHADRGVYTIDYDYVVVNNGTLKDLKEKALEFVDKIRKEDWESIGQKEIYEIAQEGVRKNDSYTD